MGENERLFLEHLTRCALLLVLIAGCGTADDDGGRYGWGRCLVGPTAVRISIRMAAL